MTDSGRLLREKGKANVKVSLQGESGTSVLSCCMAQSLLRAKEQSSSSDPGFELTAADRPVPRSLN